MKRLIYCNEHIREKNPTDPVIVVQVGEEVIYTNEVTILCPDGKAVATMSFCREGFGAPGHEVRVAIEVKRGAILAFPGQDG